jgi:hypothetical protein
MMFSDSDHASDKDLISRGAYIGLYQGLPCSWKSKKLDAVSLSSCESEYYAATAAGSEAIYMKRLAHGLETGRRAAKEEDMATCILLVDNMAALKVLQQDGFHARTKHISVRYLWIKSQVRSGRFKTSHVPTESNIADGLTKPLKRGHLLHLMSLAGMWSLSVTNGGECDEYLVNALETLRPTSSSSYEFKIWRTSWQK